MYDDWDLVEASFATQYGIRLRSEPDMSWSEFSSLLAGLMPKTPLGQIVAVRSEDDKEMLKNFTKEQHRIRNEWRSKQINSMTEEEKKNKVKELQDIFAKAFG